MTVVKPYTRINRSGFALVLTMWLMVLVVTLILAMLSLSSVALRTTSANSAREEARQNARLAALVALGELQRLAGHDTRVTASSRLFSESSVEVTGVWRSWEGSDRGSDGKPTTPDFDSKKTVGDLADPYVTAGEGRFLGWLASPSVDQSSDPLVPRGLFAESGSDTVPLVSEGTVGAGRQVHATPTMLDAGGRKGAMAWWVSGENSKAMLSKDRIDEPSSTAGWQQRIRSNGRADPATFGLEELDALPVSTVIPSRESLGVVDENWDSTRSFNDVTHFSSGLLTNTATGGWRRDLSLLSENYASYPERELPSLTILPGEIQTFSKAETGASSHPPNPLLYPWAQYRRQANRSAWQQTPPIGSWTALTDYMLQYRDLVSSSATKTSMPFFANSLGGKWDRFRFQEQVRRAPVIARIQWIFSLCSRETENAPDSDDTHQAGMLITPVVTLWNPYNVEITTSSYSMSIKGPFAPISFRFRVGDETFGDTSLANIVRNNRFNIRINSSFTLGPGESRIFGLSNNTPQESSNANNISLTPGYEPNGGFLFYGINRSSYVYGKASDQFSVEEFGYGGEASDDGSRGLGIYMDVRPAGKFLAHRMVFKKSFIAGATNQDEGTSVINELYPPVTNSISSTLGGVEGIKNKPFAGAIFGFRPATPRPEDPKFAKLHTKGLLVGNPLCYYTELGAGDGDRNAHVTMADTGTYHPINAAYDYIFQDVNGWNDTQSIPQFEFGTNRGYIVSGLTAGNGLTRCVVAELPTRPLQSLPDLQHFDARLNNPIPPFHFNLIGNGSAHPIFAPDQLFVTSSNHNREMCNDDSYLLNHLLFDDWFISSVAPDLVDFSKNEERDIETVYDDHLSLEEPLANRFYLPAPGADPDFDVSSGAKSDDSGKYNYETIASQLEVRGMVNVNSVSIEAWKSWLRHGRKMQVPFLSESGATSLDDETSYAFPRTSIAGDEAADSGSDGSNPLFPAASEFSGYRTLSEEQIDALAVEIVNEIRERGPFLSLSEFVNRRLTTDKSLAKAGAIQQALDTLSESGSSTENPFKVLQENSMEITESAPGDTAHKFPEAAHGHSAFGLPGWIRQADILRPLAPLISVRDDTFVIRGYGDSRDKTDNSKILARAWCEIVVCRRGQYVDPADSPQTDPFSSQMVSESNKRFGRRFEIVSFRWLNAKEV